MPNSAVIDGRKYILVEEREYLRLSAARNTVGRSGLPSPPVPDHEGNRDALAYARVSLARDMVRDRLAAGLSQRELAALAKIPYLTLVRLERGAHSPTKQALAKIEAALQRATRKKSPTTSPKGWRP